MTHLYNTDEHNHHNTNALDKKTYIICRPGDYDCGQSSNRLISEDLQPITGLWLRGPIPKRIEVSLEFFGHDSQTRTCQ